MRRSAQRLVYKISDGFDNGESLKSLTHEILALAQGRRKYSQALEMGPHSQWIDPLLRDLMIKGFKLCPISNFNPLRHL